MATFETEVLEVISRTPGVKSFRFKTAQQARFLPGQFFLLTIKIDSKEATKHFSFSNSPTENSYIEFTKRITD
ncbi:MAG: xylene monooxygenase, partial [Candidatus Omnitrophica bacterium]|nr:xylene monooxygenase [Candidatus Omnitrophota bacterium]